MELKWLEDFLSLVDTRNFTRSAELRFTTQPAFSRRIRSLEEWIGTPLIERATQPVSLTAAGQKFRPAAEEMLRRLYQAREDIRLLDHAAANTISFTATHSVSLNFFPRWIRRIEEHKGVLFTRLDSNQVEDCVQALQKAHVHFMLCHAHNSVDLHLPADSFTSIVVGSDRLLPVTVPDAQGLAMHALPGTRQHPAHYLAYAGTSAIGRAVEHLLDHCADKPHLEQVFVSHLAAVLESMVRAGRGLAWLPESQVKDDLNQGRLVVAGDERWVVPVEIRLFRPKDGLPPKSEEFWAAVVASQADQA
ncbi:MAG: LysR substrate-binding domain-containing protein [Hydrogenophaga sp.]|nr:LysR substrate-binding domain-containing protein [Hydrogenophaga sp.]